MAISEEERRDLIRRLEEMAARLDPHRRSIDREADEYRQRRTAEEDALDVLGRPGEEGRHALAEDYLRAAKQARRMYGDPDENH